MQTHNFLFSFSFFLLTLRRPLKLVMIILQVIYSYIVALTPPEL